MWQATEAACHFVVFLDTRRMGSLLLKAKETQKLSTDFQRDFEPCCITPLDIGVLGEVGMKPILARGGPCPSAVCHSAVVRVSYLQGYGHGRQTRLTVLGF